MHLLRAISYATDGMAWAILRSPDGPRDDDGPGLSCDGRERGRFGGGFVPSVEAPEDRRAAGL